MAYPFSTILLQQLCDKVAEPRVIVKAQSPRFEIVVYNEAFAQVSQTQGEELAGMSMAEIKKWNSNNEEGSLEIYDALCKAIETKSVFRLPAVRYDLPAADGTLTTSWWQAAYEPLINPEEQVEYILCVIRNITEMVENSTTEK